MAIADLHMGFCCDMHAALASRLPPFGCMPVTMLYLLLTSQLVTDGLGPFGVYSSALITHLIHGPKEHVSGVGVAAKSNRLAPAQCVEALTPFIQV